MYLYIPNRLSYGTKLTCAIFQKIMEKVLQGIPETKVSLDDIIITGKTWVEHLINLKLF